MFCFKPHALSHFWCWNNEMKWKEFETLEQEEGTDKPTQPSTPKMTTITATQLLGTLIGHLRIDDDVLAQLKTYNNAEIEDALCGFVMSEKLSPKRADRIYMDMYNKMSFPIILRVYLLHHFVGIARADPTNTIAVWAEYVHFCRRVQVAGEPTNLYEFVLKVFPDTAAAK